MEKETFRNAFNAFLKMYFDSCKEVYEELDLKGLKERHFKYLKAIDQEKSITMSKLADMFDLSKPTITEMLRRFEETSLIKRTQCKDDARVYNITLTKRGQLLAKTNRLESDRAIEKIFARLDENELLTLKKIFNKIGTV